MKKGVFTQGEEEKIKKSLLSYACEHNLTDDELISLIVDKQNKKETSAWTKIAECLPNRSVQSIHNLCHRIYHPDNYQGRWTPNEETQLLKLVKEHDQSWKKIAEIMKRTPTNVKDKYKQLGGANATQREGEWTLVDYIRLLVNIDNLIDKHFLKRPHIKFTHFDDQMKVFEDSPEGPFLIAIDMKEEVNKNRIYNLLRLILDIKVLMEVIEEKIEISWATVSAKLKKFSIDDCRNKFVEIQNHFGLNKKMTAKRDLQMVNTLLMYSFDSLSEVDYSVIKNKRDDTANKSRLEDLFQIHDPFSIKSFNDTLTLIYNYLEKQLQNTFEGINPDEELGKEKSRQEKMEKRRNILSLYKEFKEKRNKI